MAGFFGLNYFIFSSYKKMTAAFDKNELKDQITSLINSKPVNINQFVKRHSYLLLNLLAENLQLNCNTISCKFENNSWWSKGADLMLSFKLAGADLSISINRKGYYEVKFTKFTPSIYHVLQYLPGEENLLIENVKKYIKENSITAKHYLDRIAQYSMCSNNNVPFTIYKNLATELEENCNVIGYKDIRFSLTKYLEASFRTEYTFYKYVIAYKKKDNLIFLIIDMGPKHFKQSAQRVMVSAMLLKLESHQVIHNGTLVDLNSKNITELLQHINS